MIALGTKRRRSTVPLAALLLVLQGLAGGAVALAHASEQLNAPIHIEAQHQSSCIPLHNELRCALCHYAATRVVPQQARVQPPAVTRPERRRVRLVVVPASDAVYDSSPPRAPPPSSL